MNRNQWLLLATCALSLYSVGNIWPVQLSSYRLWKYVGPREFHAYHLAWWHSIWGVILGARRARVFRRAPHVVVACAGRSAVGRLGGARAPDCPGARHRRSGGGR